MKKAPNDPVLIWSNKRQRWWKADSQGYTADLAKAGIYRRSDALSQTYAKGNYDGAIVEPGEVADQLWKRRGEPGASQMIFDLGLLQVEQAPRLSRPPDLAIFPFTHAIQPTLNPENAQLVVDGLIALEKPEARALAEQLFAMTQEA